MDLRIIWDTSKSYIFNMKPVTVINLDYVRCTSCKLLQCTFLTTFSFYLKDATCLPFPISVHKNHVPIKFSSQNSKNVCLSAGMMSLCKCLCMQFLLETLKQSEKSLGEK